MRHDCIDANILLSIHRQYVPTHIGLEYARRIELTDSSLAMCVHAPTTRFNNIDNSNEHLYESCARAIVIDLDVGGFGEGTEACLGLRLVGLRELAFIRSLERADGVENMLRQPMLR